MRACAGHVLDVKARELKVDLHNENQVKIVLPETAEFLKADLTGDPAAALEKAEGQQANSD